MGDRHQFRAKWYDYGGGIYFVTICCAHKRHLFGEISNDEMYLNELGIIANRCIDAIPKHHADTEICNKVVMPNHIHLVISVGARYIAPASTNASTNTSNNSIGCLKPPMHGEACGDFHHNSRLATIVGTFKAAVTREYNRLMRARYIAPLLSSQSSSSQSVTSSSPQSTSMKIWQRLYHEHIIRDQWAFDNIMHYIDNNVANWGKDCFF